VTRLLLGLPAPAGGEGGGTDDAELDALLFEALIDGF
jgi:hypothetical protein